MVIALLENPLAASAMMFARHQQIFDRSVIVPVAGLSRKTAASALNRTVSFAVKFAFNFNALNFGRLTITGLPAGVDCTDTFPVSGATRCIGRLPGCFTSGTLTNC